MDEGKYPIREDWEEYYKTLEGIRRTGVVNMWCAAPVLQECYPDLDHTEAKDILLSWIENYSTLAAKYGWRN